ncbi:MAG: nodulation protein NfeD [Dehalococcoidia bacterium]|nr:nodulation protein NfeD [Dehalococcoidia bacterium]
MSTFRVAYSSILLVLLVLFAGLTVTVSGQNGRPVVDVLRVDGTVNPSLVRYINRGISKAENDGAVACLIELDTPGGLLSSTEDIVRRISEASVPVIVYVPEGSWAASAGAFITLAADVAAMAPGSVIGASTPISSGSEELSDDERAKAVNLASHWIKGIAEDHGRNEAAAMAAVTEAASFSSSEASGAADLSSFNRDLLRVERLNPPLIDDAGARDIEELLVRLQAGIVLANGETFSVPPEARLRYVGMTAMERFLLQISDPTIAYILLSIGMLGILIELLHPGVVLPGVLGGVCLLLGVYSLGVLEANYAGLLLMLLAFALFVAEAFTPTFGALFAGGMVSLVAGSLLLFSGTPFEVNPWVMGVVIGAIALIFILVVMVIIRSQRRPVNTGREGLIGQTAVVRAPLDPKGTVFVEGEIWNALMESGRANPGEEVVVTAVEGLRLKVVKKSN